MGVVSISFQVFGFPVTQGSKRGYPTPGGHVRLVDDAKGLADWRALVAQTAWASRPGGWKLLEGPLALNVQFLLRTPKKPQSWAPCLKQDDLDKLLRAVCDSLTEVVWVDDGQVVNIEASKRYAPSGKEGAIISVGTVSPPEYPQENS